MGLSRIQALDCFASDDLIGIGMEADAVRRRLHPEGVVTYAIDGSIDAAATSADTAKSLQTIDDLGGTSLLLKGPVASLDALEALIRDAKRHFPQISIAGLTCAEIVQAAGSLSLPETLLRLHDAGMDSIGSADPEAPHPLWLDVHRAAHRAGMKTATTIVFGAGETLEQRVDALAAIANLQSETGGFIAVAPVSFHAVGGRELDEATAVEYLKTLAITRLLLDGIPNVQSDWTTQGLKILQMGLRFGANDAGSVRVEHAQRTTEEEMRRIIRDAGFRPCQRDLLYRAMMLT